MNIGHPGTVMQATPAPTQNNNGRAASSVVTSNAGRPSAIFPQFRQPCVPQDDALFDGVASAYGKLTKLTGSKEKANLTESFLRKSNTEPLRIVLSEPLLNITPPSQYKSPLLKVSGLRSEPLL